jgi:hypothetical protein
MFVSIKDVIDKSIDDRRLANGLVAQEDYFVLE